VRVRVGVGVGASDDEANEGGDHSLDFIEKVGVNLFDIVPGERNVDARANFSR
jgi:GTP cyclohydrolase III